MHLTWSHYAVLLQVPDSKAREWYAKEASEQTWSVRTLRRSVSSQYYYRMLQTQRPELVETEMKNNTSAYAERRLEFIKNPVVAEFLGLSDNTDFTETDLETSIISNLQKFLMELEKAMPSLHDNSIFALRNRIITSTWSFAITFSSVLFCLT